MEKHVFVVALSTFSRKRPDGLTPMRQTTYVYEERTESDEPSVTFRCQGYYQLEPIPRFLKEKIGCQLTDVILLATDETTDAEEGRNLIFDHERPAFLDEETSCHCTPLAYYEKYLHALLGENLNIQTIPVDERDPAKALEDTMEAIRSLHRHTTDPSEWELWIDTHGGFRDISLALVSASRFFATDRKEVIRTDGIFSVYHSQKGDTNDRIQNQTAFYFGSSSKALKDFLDYGQYLSVKFRPYEGKAPYAFISYKHNTAYIATRNVLTALFEMKIPFWYDDGIQSGEDWDEKLAEKNNNSDAFIMLLSRKFFTSAECMKELIRAIANRKRKNTGWETIHYVFLEDGISFPNGIPVGEHMDIARKLQAELNVSDRDITDFFSYAAKHQGLQWFQYMDKEHAVADKSWEEMKEKLRNGLDGLMQMS